LQKPIGLRSSRTLIRRHILSVTGPKSRMSRPTACVMPSGAANDRPAPYPSGRSSASSESSVTRSPARPSASMCSGIARGGAPTLPATASVWSFVTAPCT